MWVWSWPAELARFPFDVVVYPLGIVYTDTFFPRKDKRPRKDE